MMGVVLTAGIAAGALGAPVGTTTSGTTTTTPTGTRGTTTGAVATAPGTTTGTTTAGNFPVASTAPVLSSLRLDRTATSQRGHAQFLVGVRSSTPSKVTVQLIDARDGKLVRTATEAETQGPGRHYLLVEATTDQRFQIPAGRYRVAVQASDPQGRTSNVLRGTFLLVLTTPRGRLDAVTVPNWPALARQLGHAAGGQLVAAVGPGGPSVKAGLRRGDVVTKLGERTVDAPGAFTAALRALPAEQPVNIEFRRGAETRRGILAAQPDWTPAPDWPKAFEVILERDPNILAYRLADARQLVDAGTAPEAQAQLDAWPPGLRRTAPAEILQGEILLAQGDARGALGAYNRAVDKDPTLASGQFGRGLSLSRLTRNREALAAFDLALKADRTDAVATAFRAYTLLRLDRTDEGLDAANRAIALDALYEDGHVARGLALIAKNRKADGVRALKRGLLLLFDPTRARELIDENLEPNDP
jgi:Flp pilus assembly protein TadD